MASRLANCVGMDVLTLARIQFGATVAFHYLYPPLSIGLGVLLVVMEGLWLKTKNPVYHQMARFWTKVFALTFAIGVATGIVMEFEFGTNWATYSRFVGDVFGSALAAEGIFAFFLESGFLAVLLFGWDKVSRKVHFFSTCMVCLGAHFSAVWIVVANSWMQTPAGYQHRDSQRRAARGNHGFLATGVQSVVHGPAVSRAVRRVAGGRVSCCERQRVVSAEETASGFRARLAAGRPDRGARPRRCCNWSAATAARKAWRKINRPNSRRLKDFTTPLPTRRSRSPAGWTKKIERVVGIQVPGMLSFLAHNDVHATVIGLDDYRAAKTARRCRRPSSFFTAWWALALR